jgi:hypothetical protein
MRKTEACGSIERNSSRPLTRALRFSAIALGVGLLLASGVARAVGYQTPSSSYAYGTGPKESLNKEYNPAAGKYGE